MRRMKPPLRRESFYDDALPHLPTVENPFLSGWLACPRCPRLSCPGLSWLTIPIPVCICCLGLVFGQPSTLALRGVRFNCDFYGASIVSLSLFLSLLLSLFPSLTPSPAQAVNFYWFQWARICTVIAQAGHGRTRLTRRATRQGAPA